MRYVSLFSGVEAASVAWSRLGWEPLAFAEVDEFPAAVLAARFPDVPNLGDVCKIDWKEFNDRYGTVDVLIGGSPCQSFSIAGNRTGLEGASGLMWQFCRAIRELVEASGGGGPRYVLWENVPGALSSGPKGQKGEDFGCLLRELEECGYGLAWRVLDSQFARVPDGSPNGFAGPVPQRRRRVFLVGSLGTDGAGDILFERSCLRGDHPKGREAREALARDSEGGAGMGDSEGFKYNQRPSSGPIGYGPVSPTVDADSHPNAVLTFAQNTRDEVRLFGGDGQTVGALSAQPGMKQTSYVMTQFGEVAGTLRARGDSSPNADGGQNVVCMGSQQGRAAVYEDVCPTVTSAAGTSGNNQSVVCMESAQARSVVETDQAPTLNASYEQTIVCAADDNGKTAIEEDMCGALKVGGGVALNSNGEMVVGTLCTRDWKGVGNEYFNEGKVICQKYTC